MPAASPGYWRGLNTRPRPGAVLEATEKQFSDWRVVQRYGWDTGLPLPIWGIPDAWPHVAQALERAGYEADPATHQEALFGGSLASVPDASDPPTANLELRRTVWQYGTRFSAMLGDQEVAWCGIQTDLTDGGLSPALGGWAWLDELGVLEGSRNQGVGSWLVRHAIAWARLGRRDRVVIPVADENEAAGAGRFYRRFGWDVLVRERHGWRAPHSGAP